jgi:dipeptidyl aminopeptidase/acylaminoacyl peptidase
VSLQVKRDTGRTWRTFFVRGLVFGFQILWFAVVTVAQAVPHGTQKRVPATVADAIRMTRFADPAYILGEDSAGKIAQVSPDGRRFVVVFRKGNLQHNTNEFFLLLWSKTGHSLSSKPLLTMASSSNRPAIKEIHWLSDNETLVFIGENTGELAQVYSFHIPTHRLRRITNHSTNIIDYSVTPNGAALVFVAEEHRRSMWNPRTERRGIAVERQSILNLIAGEDGTLPGREDSSGLPRLFYEPLGGPERRIRTRGILSRFNSNLAISPDGGFVLLTSRVESVPTVWQEYADPWVHAEATRVRSSGQSSWLRRFELIDLRTGENRIPLNSPCATGTGCDAVWAPDGRSMLISNLYLPLEGTNGEASELRKSTPFSIEVHLPDGMISEITRKGLKLLRWDSSTGSAVFTESVRPMESANRDQRFYFRKRHGRWEEIATLSAEEKEKLPPKVMLVEDMNTPPKLFLAPSDGSSQKLLFDLNPQFASLEFGRVEAVHWVGPSGQKFKGGLYYPVGFLPGQKYPLVIQTHGFNARRFWIDGPWTTAYAAQPLAAKGVLVLQADESYEDHDTPKETDREAERLESAVDYLDARGLIDRTKVGLLGFSRTCLYIKYVLTHSRYRFAAASVSDGMDAGYFQYLLSGTSSEWTSMNEAINGGLPWGKGLDSWRVRSPGLNVDHVQTPLLIVAQNPTVALGEWEWFAALRRLDKPVDMIMLRNGEHILQKPWERLVSQQGNVDWFVFWLNDEEDPDPAKAQQYLRWRRLKDKLEAIQGSWPIQDNPLN